MTTELWATLIGAIVLLLTNTAAAIKLWGDVQKTKADRAQTKETRDKDSTELHDQCQKNTWDIGRVKEDILMLKTHMDDHQVQIATINTELAKVSTKLDTVLDAINKLSEDRK
jgi:peptidoglycan hydrolase CwlO-like protein